VAELLDKRYAATPMTGPNFVKLAEAYRLTGLLCDKRSDVKSTVEKTLAAKGAVVIDFVVEKEDAVFPMVPAGADLDKMIAARPKQDVMLESGSDKDWEMPSSVLPNVFVEAKAEAKALNGGAHSPPGSRRRRRPPSPPRPPAADLPTLPSPNTTLIAYVEDVPGVLNRIASLFRRRNSNIDSLTVGRTEQPGVSRLTVLVEATEARARIVEAKTSTSSSTSSASTTSPTSPRSPARLRPREGARHPADPQRGPAADRRTSAPVSSTSTRPRSSSRSPARPRRSASSSSS